MCHGYQLLPLSSFRQTDGPTDNVWHLGSDHRLAIANLWVRQTNRRTYLRQTYKKDNIPFSKKRRQCEPEQEGAVKTYGGEEGKINSIFTIDKLTCYIVDNLN